MALQCLHWLLTALAGLPDMQRQCGKCAGMDIFADVMQALEERQQRERLACLRRRRSWRHPRPRTCLRMARSALRCRRLRPCMLACLPPDLTSPAAPANGSQGERQLSICHFQFTISSGSSDDGKLVCGNVCVTSCAYWLCWGVVLQGWICASRDCERWYHLLWDAGGSQSLERRASPAGTASGTAKRPTFLQMPTSTTLTGTQVCRTPVVSIHWRHRFGRMQCLHQANRQ